MQVEDTLELNRVIQYQFGGLNREGIARERPSRPSPQGERIEFSESLTSQYGLENPEGNDEYVEEQDDLEGDLIKGSQEDMVEGDTKMEEEFVQEVPPLVREASKPMPSGSSSHRATKKTPTPQSRVGSSHQKRPPSILRQASIPRDNNVNKEEGVENNEQWKKSRQDTGKEIIMVVGPSKGDNHG